MSEKTKKKISREFNTEAMSWVLHGVKYNLDPTEEQIKNLTNARKFALLYGYSVIMERSSAGNTKKDGFSDAQRRQVEREVFENLQSGEYTKRSKTVEVDPLTPEQKAAAKNLRKSTSLDVIGVLINNGLEGMLTSEQRVIWKAHKDKIADDAKMEEEENEQEELPPIEDDDDEDEE